MDEADRQGLTRSGDKDLLIHQTLQGYAEEVNRAANGKFTLKVIDRRSPLGNGSETWLTLGTENSDAERRRAIESAGRHDSPVAVQAGGTFRF
jgi:hypothetical protein